MSKSWVTLFNVLPRGRERKNGGDAGNGGSHYPSRLGVHLTCLLTAWWWGVAGEVLSSESYAPDSGKSGAERRHCFCLR